MLRIKPLCGLMLTLALTAPATTAHAQDDKWHLRFGGVWLDSDAVFSEVDSDGNRIEASFDGALGIGLGLERLFSRRFGLELGAIFAEPDIDAGLGGSVFNASNGVNLTSITLGFNFHLTPDKAVDLYLGPLLAYMTYDDHRFVAQVGDATLSADLSSSDNFTAGAQIGADIRFGDGPWSLNLTARYIDSSLDLITGDDRVTRELDFDPLILGVGVGYRF